MSEENENRFAKAFRSVGLGSPAVIVAKPPAPPGVSMTTPAPSARMLNFTGASPAVGESPVASSSRFINVFGGVQVIYPF